MGMKEIKTEVVYSQKYDININRYLTYAQIQQIVNAIEAASESDDSWSTRQTNIDMLVLFHATDIGKEKLEEIGHEALLTCGLIDEVNNTIDNTANYVSDLYNFFLKFDANAPTSINEDLPFYNIINDY